MALATFHNRTMLQPFQSVRLMTTAAPYSFDLSHVIRREIAEDGASTCTHIAQLLLSPDASRQQVRCKHQYQLPAVRSDPIDTLDGTYRSDIASFGRSSITGRTAGTGASLDWTEISRSCTEGRESSSSRSESSHHSGQHLFMSVTQPANSKMARRA